MPRAFYDPSNPSTTTVYRVAEAGDPFFIPAYPEVRTENRDDPGLKAEQLAQCQKIASKQAISATGVDPVTVNYQGAEGVPTDS